MHKRLLKIENREFFILPYFYIKIFFDSKEWRNALSLTEFSFREK